MGNAIARSNLFASRDPQTRIYTDRQWFTPFVGGSYQFPNGAERLLDARMMFFYYATGITSAMTESRPGTGSAYAISVRDANGSYLDGQPTKPACWTTNDELWPSDRSRTPATRLWSLHNA